MEFTALGTAELVRRALKVGTVIPGFNIPYLPMMEPVVRALSDTNSFGLIMVARLEWVKFESGSLEVIRDEYERVKDPNHTRLHLDHVPVVDEDDLEVDYEEIIRRAVTAGYDSVMIDGSRLPLEGNIDCTKKIVDIAHAAGIGVEAELGAVMGHEAGPLPPYDELFESGRGFTDPAEAKRFVEETNTDWLSVAVGSIHGAVSAARKDEKKVEARLDIDRLDAIRQAVGIPLVLHGGTGIRKEYIMRAIEHGIGKINVATAIRQPYEKAVKQSVAAGQEAVYQAMLAVIHEDLEIGNSAARLA
ncbi:MAG: class II fructose-bisphosphate aldolase [Thermoguttaceae bacterium]|jgi:ketose-bisphosphate aldolase|nr:class II fructose-bisphosphate aldolase [Thermoguttaceae bacterium]